MPSLPQPATLSINSRPWAVGLLAHYEARVTELLARKRGVKPVPDQLKDLEGAIERRKKTQQNAKATQR